MSRKNRKKTSGTANAVNLTIQKAANEKDSVSRLRMGEMGTVALSQIRADAENMKVIELRWPNFIATVECMKQDATVATALDSKYTFVEKAFDEFKVLSNKDSKESQDAADFVEFCFKNMDGQTLRQFARSAATFNEYGFSIFEKLYTVVQAGEYAGRMKIKKLAFRPQASLARNNPFVYGDQARTVIGVRQALNAFVNNSRFDNFGAMEPIGSMAGPNSTIVIPVEKLMIMSYGGTDANAAGTSPLVGCYRAFREKILIENLEVVGATKDLGGVIELKIPSQILNKAAQDPSSPEAEMVKGLMGDAANAHAGEQAFFMLPSDMREGAPQYSMTLKGIDGSGKQYNTQDLINSRKKSILDRFGAGFINLGNDQQGSYNLSESKQTIHSHFVQRDINIMVECLNENLIPQLLALNGIRLSQKDMPRIKSGLISDVDMEEFSKFVQRTGAVGYLPKTPSVINKILEVGGFDERVDDNMSTEELLKILGQDQSRSGDGMAAGTSGNGTAKISGTRDNSVSNMDN